MVPTIDPPLCPQPHHVSRTVPERSSYQFPPQQLATTPSQSHPPERLRKSFADSASGFQNLVDVGLATLLASLAVPRADIGKFPAGVALSISRAVLGRPQAHPRAVIDKVVLKSTVVSKLSLSVKGYIATYDNAAVAAVSVKALAVRSNNAAYAGKEHGNYSKTHLRR